TADSRFGNRSHREKWFFAFYNSIMRKVSIKITIPVYILQSSGRCVPAKAIITVRAFNSLDTATEKTE
ncbi:MAG: hypothetical protein OXN17_12355, partial [Candidatus Poribacteria bacterium]|nr:hypothetical protein [Candidatus Poribacteria bacterium]